MLLAIDVGNTQTVLGVYRDNELVHMWRIGTNKCLTTDELRERLRGLFLIDHIQIHTIDGVILSTVVPELRRRWCAVAKRMFKIDALVVSADLVGDLIDLSAYPSPDIGQDRIADAVAARAIFGSPAIVVDFGTATNMEVVDRSGRFLGGAIAPGIEMSLSALVEKTALLPAVEFVDPGVAFGTTTAEAMQVGIVYGEVDRVDGIVRRMWKQLGYETCVIATGGMATTVAPLCSTVTDIDAELTLEGLRIIYRNTVMNS
ncbi:MAG: type III pantothenate kinase [Eggerthellaceae bacterium]|jgi:type III pantothenate kinase|nr:type III pantothenate kinase [Eggerthellaceae bacterium]MCH4220847.1 type III pantothenate kinase [Eggerthellaceae bacterium]